MDAVRALERRSDAELVELRELRVSVHAALVHINHLADTLGDMNSASPPPQCAKHVVSTERMAYLASEASVIKYFVRDAHELVHRLCVARG